MADSVLLTCWPPAPLERKVSICRSVGLISTSTSSASGSTATVTVEVWMRPLRLRLRHPLDPVDAAFVFQPGIGPLAADA